MKLTLNELRSRVERLYPSVEEVGPSVLRFTRKTDRLAFAVCYLDIGEGIPQTPEELHDYLNQVVAKRFFDGRSSLQWNTYLYFITSAEWFQTQNARGVKEFVEQDRIYARKFVIPEGDLDSVLHPRVPESTSHIQPIDAVTPWITILERARLTEAVFGDYPLPKRLELIGRSDTADSLPISPMSANSKVLLPAIRRLTIEAFRKYTAERVFDFGEVNLLFGANGTGKTSLLEAIELCFCGKTRRNPKQQEKYRFVFLDSNGVQSVNDDRPLRLFRERNLDWYGVREEKVTTLQDGFSRFNFLNTDAAIELSQSPGEISEALARLLVGSDAAKTWHVIKQLQERVRTEIASMRTLQEHMLQDINLLDTQLTETIIKGESDSVRSALREALRRHAWIADVDLDSATGDIIAKLTELNAALKGVGELPWLDAPVTLEIVESYCERVSSILSECAPSVVILKNLQENNASLTESARRQKETLSLIDELAVLVSAGVDRRSYELAMENEVIVTCMLLTSRIDDTTMNIVSRAIGDLTVTDYYTYAVAARKEAVATLVAAQRQHDDFVKLRDRSLSLAQELREVASKILNEEPSDQCPLCHTQFQPGELPHRMALGVDEHLEAKAQELLGSLRNAEELATNNAAIEQAADQIVALCKHLGILPTALLKDVVARVNEAKLAQVQSRKRADALETDIRATEAQGLTTTRLTEVLARLSALGVNLADQSPLAVSSCKADAAHQLENVTAELIATTQQSVQLQASIDQAVQAVLSGEGESTVAIAKLDERLAVTRSVLATLKRFLPQFKWDASRPIAEWMIEAGAVREIATQLRATVEKEIMAARNQSEARLRREPLHLKERAQAVVIDRFAEVEEALTEICTKHSLETLTDSALRANRECIEMIFRQIHSPAEFTTIEPSWRLIRQDDRVETPLTMISTGQRAAFALAVFLAQNSQLRVGPRVILIDDPIAHIDDLNSLSFLDYLREIALTGKRQIFFATASGKLASLFERKFDFLGEEFKRFNLTRDGIH